MTKPSIWPCLATSRPGRHCSAQALPWLRICESKALMSHPPDRPCMGRPYSRDLRERVVWAVESGRVSRNQATQHYGVAISTAINWVRRKRETGSVAPGQMGRHKPKKIRGAHHDWLLERVQVRDFTLKGPVAELAERGLKVDYRPTRSTAEVARRPCRPQSH